MTFLFKICAFSLFFNVNSIVGEKSELSVNQFYRLPTLNRFDNYHECMGLYAEKAVYCVADTFIKPDDDSEIFKLIKEHNKDTKTHFRHDNLVRGFCVNNCEEIIKNLENADSFYVEEFPIESKIIYHSVNYHNSSEDRVKYAKIVNQCVNVELNKKYGLKGFSKIEYCLNEFNKPPLDALDIAAACIFAVIFLLVIASSFYDRILRNSSNINPETHYGLPIKDNTKRWLTLFSIRRNWVTLCKPSDKRFEELQFFNGIRTFLLSMVVWSHATYFSEFLPSSNPEANEGSYSSILAVLFFNGLNIIQMFYIISGFLATYRFLEHEETGRKTRSPRYLRFFVLHGLAILLHATWVYRLGYGPIFNKINFAEQQFCRKHWWKNMLFIDNYTNGEEKCMFQTWYMASEVWLSIIGGILLVIIKKKPAIKTVLIGSLFGISAFIYGYIVYINKYEPIYIYSPETLKNRVVPVLEGQVNYFKDVHIPTHLNLGSYFIGMMMGFIYRDFKKSGRVLQKNFISRSLWCLSFILTGFNFASGIIFYHHDLEKPSLLVAILAVYYKYGAAILYAYIIFGMIFRFGWFLPNLANHPVWRVTGRISFATYMFHVAVVQLIVMEVYQPIHLDGLKIFVMSLGTIVLSLIVGLFFHLAVEMPVSKALDMRGEPNSEIALDVMMERSPITSK